MNFLIEAFLIAETRGAFRANRVYETFLRSRQTCRQLNIKNNVANDVGSGATTVDHSLPTRNSSNCNVGAPTVFTFRKLNVKSDANESASPGALVSVGAGGVAAPNVLGSGLIHM